MSWRKWPPASRLFAVLALLFGSAAFLLVHAESARVNSLRPGSAVPVVVATTGLPAGTRLGPDELRQASIPSSFAPPGALTSIRIATGRTLLAPLASGEAVTATRVTAGRGGPIATLVPPGLRAFALPPEVSNAAIHAGDHIDVFATFTSGAPHTELVAAGVQVLGEVAAESSSTDQATKRSLELLVSPQDASALAYASTFAKINVALLSPSDKATAAVPSPSTGP
jgi:Flp pilus assembly protein CpaB